MAQKEPSWWPVVLVSIIVVAASVGSAYALYAIVNKPAPAPSVLTVQEGDNVTVNYIGIFGTGFDQGKVFDTSYLSVAQDNATYPKALSFQFRGASGYTPLKAHVGPTTQGSYTSVVTGFWHAMLGVRANQTVTAMLPPSLAYGNADPSKIQTFPLIDTLPLVQTYTLANFGKAYAGISAQTGAVFTDPHYQWQDEILNQNSTSVVVEYLPQVGQIVTPYGWPVLVTEVSSTASGTGSVTIENELTSQSVGLFKGTDWANGQPFFLSGVNTQAGTYTLDYNQQVVGNTLIFQISVYRILPTLSA